MMKEVKKRNIALFVIFNTLTLGIYGIVILCKASKEVNTICEGDGKDTMFYLWVWLLGWITLGIFPVVWFYKTIERLKDNGYRYGVVLKHSGSEYLLWTLVGWLLVGIGILVGLCDFISDVNQFADVVGYVYPKKYAEHQVTRLQIEREPFMYYTDEIEPETGQLVITDNNGGKFIEDPMTHDLVELKALPPAPNSVVDHNDGGQTIYTPSATINWISGNYGGYNFPVNEGEEVIIGRDPAIANVIIDQKYTTVSKKHCGIKYDAKSNLFTVTDYSSNGTFINGGTRIAAGRPIQLAPGAVVTIGNGDNSFRLDA